MDEIVRVRTRIDEIDQDIIELLKKRYENAKYLGQLKQSRRLPARDLQREEQILRTVGKMSRTFGLESIDISRVFREIFKLSIHAQQIRNNSVTSELRYKNILIVGGTGGMGRFFARFAYVNGGNVTIVGRSKAKTRRIARQSDVEYGSIQDSANSDIVVVAVPITQTSSISIQIGSKMRNGSLLTDLSSVKSGITEEIASKIPRGVEYVSLHPLFGPQIDHLHGQHIAAVRYRTGPQWQSLARSFTDAGAKISLVTAEQHDKTMGLVQVAHHYALLTLAKSLESWNGELPTSSIRNTIKTISNFVNNWETIMGIQLLNPYAQKIRQQYAKIAESRTKIRSLASLQEPVSANVQKWSRKL